MNIFTVDARNHGSSPHTVNHDSEHMAVDVVELMRDKGIMKSCVLGHSMGGRAMMYLSLKYPELVDRAIFVDISPIEVPRDFHHMEQIFKAMENVNIPAGNSLSQGRKIAQNQIKDAVQNETTIEFILMNLQKRGNGEFYWIPNIEVIHKNWRLFNNFLDNVKHLAPFSGPVMFICGNQSNFPKQLAIDSKDLPKGGVALARRRPSGTITQWLRSEVATVEHNCVDITNRKVIQFAPSERADTLNKQIIIIAKRNRQ